MSDLNFLDTSGNKITITTPAVNTLAFNTSTVERLRIASDGSIGINETSPASTLVVRKDNQGGRGGEISIVNGSGSGANSVGNEAALNFGLENSTYQGNDGNAQIKAVTTASNHATDIVISNWSGSNFVERLRIKSDGIVTKPYNPAFIVGRTGGNEVHTPQPFPFNVARLNVGNHYNTSTYKFVAPVAGIYYFYGQVYYNNGTGTYRVGFRKTPNGGSAFMLNTAQHAMVGNDNQQNISIIESLGVGDTVELWSDQNTAITCYYNINNTSFGAHTYFMGYLIG